MVGKGLLGILIAVLIVLAAQPFDVSEGKTRAFEKYDMENLPPQDVNGNFTLDEDDEWRITGEGFFDGNITIFEESVIIMEDANITVNGTIWARDRSEIIIRSSILRLEIQMPGPVLIEKQYDNPNGFALIEDDVTFTVENSSIYLPRSDVFQIAPEGMMVPIEVLVNFGKFYMTNTYLNTEGSISMGMFNQTIIRGIVMHMNSEFAIYDSNITSGIVFYVNSHGTIHNTDFRSLSMQKNTAESLIVLSKCSLTRTATIAGSSNAILLDCLLNSALIARGHGSALLVNTTMEGLKLEDNATVTLDKSHLWGESSFLGGNNVWDNASLSLLNSSFVDEMHFHENTSLALVNSSMNCTVLADNSQASLSGSFIENLTAEGDSAVWLRGSDLYLYHLQNNARISNLTDVVVKTTLNEQPLSVQVDLMDDESESMASAPTNENGKTIFTLIRDIISIDGTTGDVSLTPNVTYCHLTASYENLHEEEAVNITDEYIEVNLEFNDYTVPAIEDVDYEVDPLMNTNEDVLVTVRAVDEETNLAKVILKYSIDDGRSWSNITLYGTGENEFENSIPGQSDGTKVRFYIVSEDNAGNTAESRYYAYTAGESVIMINNLIVIVSATLVIGLIIFISTKSLLGKKRIKRYLHKTQR